MNKSIQKLKLDKKGSIIIKEGIHVSMICGFLHHKAPEFSSISFFQENLESVEQVAKERGWHYSRKYGWLCDQKHHWRRIKNA